MAKLVLLLVFVCFQFSRSEELVANEQVGLDLNLDDEAPFNNQTAPNFENLDEAYENLEDEAPFNDQTAPLQEMLDGADEDQWYKGEYPNPEDEAPFNNQTAPNFENIDEAYENLEDEAPFNNQTAPNFENIDEAYENLEDEVPFNDQTAPDLGSLDDDFEEIKVNDKEYAKLQEEIENQIKNWEEKNPASKKPASWQQGGDLYDYGKYDDYWSADDYKDTDYLTESTSMRFEEDGDTYKYVSTATLRKLNKPNTGKMGQGIMNGKTGQDKNTPKGQKWIYGKMQPLKRFTSI